MDCIKGYDHHVGTKEGEKTLVPVAGAKLSLPFSCLRPNLQMKYDAGAYA